MSLRDTLNEIRAKYSELTPALVLEEARASTHPLHTRFEWDDAIAGEAYRLEQAHELIQSVRIVERRPNGSKLSIRAFQAIRSTGIPKYTYEPSEEIVNDPLRRQMVLREMQREISILESRYRDFEEFWQMIKGMSRRRKAS